MTLDSYCDQPVRTEVYHPDLGSKSIENPCGKPIREETCYNCHEPIEPGNNAFYFDLAFEAFHLERCGTLAMSDHHNFLFPRQVVVPGDPLATLKRMVHLQQHVLPEMGIKEGIDINEYPVVGGNPLFTYDFSHLRPTSTCEGDRSRMKEITDAVEGCVAREYRGVSQLSVAAFRFLRETL